jgi:type I restriction enzyme S subunit
LVLTEAALARAEGRDYEPADVLLERILAERRARWEAENPGKRYKEPAPVDASGLLELPEGWVWATLAQRFDVQRGRFSVRPRNDPRYYGGPYPFVQIGDLPKEGGSIRSFSQTLNEDGLRVSRMFRKGTVLIAIVGATIANTGILAFDSCCPDSLVAIQADEAVPLHYVDLYLRAKKLELRHSSYASGGQPNINLRILKPYPFPLPPADEQVRIVNEVERRLSVVGELEKQVEAALKRAERLRQAILKHAFEGRLVPQDPEDEPASVLLERIKAQRAGQGEGKGKIGKTRQMRLPKM